jgi:hypothetical protein
VNVGKFFGWCLGYLLIFTTERTENHGDTRRINGSDYETA